MLTVSTLLLASSLLAAEPAGACHCYRERTFDPVRPAAVDPYILATARSSLLSAAFGPSKRELVQAVMTGTSPDDLWIAQFAAARTGRDAAAALGAKTAKGSWRAALAGATGLGEPFGSALARGAPDAELAALVVDDTLVARLGAKPAAVAEGRAAGATTNEVIAASVLAARLGTTPASVLAPVKAGKVTWGGVLQGLGLTPQGLDGVVRGLVAPRPGGS